MHYVITYYVTRLSLTEKWFSQYFQDELVTFGLFKVRSVTYILHSDIEKGDIGLQILKSALLQRGTVWLCEKDVQP